MKLACDACGIEYEGEEDKHLKGEPNICCGACEWCYGPPRGSRPKHTCKPARIRVVMY